MINQAYAGENVQVIGLEHYATANDADTTKVRSFQQLTPGLTYPLCMGASTTRSAYQAFSSNGTADYSVVIDQNGIIKYRGDGVNVTGIMNVIDGLLATDIKQSEPIPDQFRLEQNYPNPFNPTTTIRFTLDQGQNISLRIYDISGSKIRTLLDEKRTGGAHELIWDGRNDNGQPVGSGIYVYELAGEFSRQIRKMTLIR